MNTMFESARKNALKLDEEDSLRSFRDRFHRPLDAKGRPRLYFTGNSLGLQPRNAEASLMEVLQAWRSLGGDGHFRGNLPWTKYHDGLIASMAGIMGARQSEITIMNALTVNLHLMLAAFYRPTAERFRILIEKDAFPSDQYAVAAQARWHGLDPSEAILCLNPRPGENTIRTEDTIEFIGRHGPEIAVLLLGGINYYTGQFFELGPITAAARRQGIIVGYDLAHAAGNVPLSLHDWNVDFAVWCTYKYLNAGPGSPGGVFVHERHDSNDELTRLAGWWGHDRSSRFQMPDTFLPIPGAEGWQVSNPSIPGLALLRASLDVFDEADFNRITKKGRRLTAYFEFLLRERLADRVEIVTPLDPDQRGAQLSIRIRDGRIVFERLEARHIGCDWREPDVIRAAPVPLYNSFEDVWEFVDALVTAM